MKTAIEEEIKSLKLEVSKLWDSARPYVAEWAPKKARLRSLEEKLALLEEMEEEQPA